MSKDIILAEVNVPAGSSTGKTEHLRNGKTVGQTHVLKLVRIAGEEAGVYLIHYDCEGNEITDTFHASLEEGFAQAEFEFGLLARTWKIIRK